MAITASMVKELREMTGAGMMECKKALTEADGDMDAAVDVLRTRGLAAAEKKAGRATNEGAVMTFVDKDAKTAGIVEINCETDFVSGNEKFKAFATGIAKAAAATDAADLEGFGATAAENGTVAEELTEAIHVFGENMKIARFAHVDFPENGIVVDYIHMGGKLAVLGCFTCAEPENEAFLTAAKDVCMQVAALNPVAVRREDVPAEVVAHEKEIYKAQAAESGKPENIQEKMAEGRLNKYFKEHCLLEQDFVKDGDLTVKAYLAKVSKEIGTPIDVLGVIRWGVGETA